MTSISQWKMFYLRNVWESVGMTNFLLFLVLHCGEVWCFWVDVKHFPWGFILSHLLIWKMLVWNSRTLESGLSINWAIWLCWCLVSYIYDVGRILFTVQDPDGLKHSACKDSEQIWCTWTFNECPEYINTPKFTVVIVHTIITTAIMLLVVWIHFSSSYTITH